MRWYDKCDYNASDRHLQGSIQKLQRVDHRPKTVQSKDCHEGMMLC